MNGSCYSVEDLMNSIMAMVNHPVIPHTNILINMQQWTDLPKLHTLSIKIQKKPFPYSAALSAGIYHNVSPYIHIQ
jgi:hypothetical protein